MNIKTRLAIIIMALIPLISFAQESEFNIIPKPQSIVAKEGYFTLNENTSIKGNAQFAIKYLQDRTNSATNFNLSENQNSAENFIEINITPSANIKKEGYSLSVCPDRITINASDNGGAFYGVQTLLQLLPETIYSKTSCWENWNIKCA